MQPYLRETLLDAGEQALEPVDFQIGMNARPASARRCRPSPPSPRSSRRFSRSRGCNPPGAGNVLGSLERAIKGAEGAVLGAEIGVVDIAIDDVGDHALGVEAPTDGVSLKTQTDKVGRVEIIERLLASQRHGFSLQSSVLSKPESGARTQANINVAWICGTGIGRGAGRVRAVSAKGSRRWRSR